MDFNTELIGLIEKVKCGDMDAYDEIFEKIHPLIMKNGLNVLGNLNSNFYDEEWQDHMSNLYLKVYKCVNQFNPKLNTKPTYFIARCVKYYFLAYVDGNSRRNKKNISMQTPVEEDITLEETMVSPQKSPEERFIDEEDREILSGIIKTLSEEEKIALYKYFVEKKKMVAISDEMGIKYRKINYIIKKGIEKIRIMYKNTHP